MIVICSILVSVITGVLLNVISTWVEIKLAKKKKTTVIVFISFVFGSIALGLLDNNQQNDNGIKVDNSNISIGDNNAGIGNTYIIDNSKVENIYHVTGQRKDNEKVSLVPITEGFQTTNFLATESFINCNGGYGNKNTIDFIFHLVNTNPGNYSRYIIKWGDGHENTIIDKPKNKIILKHSFPIGNSILQIEFVSNDGDVKSNSYNIFYGQGPNVFLNIESDKSYCVGDTGDFMIRFDKKNPSWTLYKFFINDDSDTLAFVNPGNNEKVISHIFTKASDKIKYSNSNKIYKTTKDGYFTVSLIAENPCGLTSHFFSRISVENCAGYERNF